MRLSKFQQKILTALSDISRITFYNLDSFDCSIIQTGNPERFEEGKENQIVLRAYKRSAWGTLMNFESPSKATWTKRLPFKP